MYVDHELWEGEGKGYYTYSLTMKVILHLQLNVRFVPS